MDAVLSAEDVLESGDVGGVVGVVVVGGGEVGTVVVGGGEVGTVVVGGGEVGTVVVGGGVGRYRGGDRRR